MKYRVADIRHFLPGGFVLILVLLFLGCSRYEDDGWGSMTRGQGWQVDVFGDTGVLLSKGENAVDKGPQGISFNHRPLNLEGKYCCWFVWGEGRSSLVKKLTARQMEDLRQYLIVERTEGPQRLSGLLRIMDLSTEQIETTARTAQPLDEPSK